MSINVALNFRAPQVKTVTEQLRQPGAQAGIGILHNRREGVCNPVPNVYAMSECIATLNQLQTFRTGQHAPSGLGAVALMRHSCTNAKTA